MHYNNSCKFTYDYLDIRYVELHSGTSKYLFNNMRHLIGDGKIGTRPGYEFRRDP